MKSLTICLRVLSRIVGGSLRLCLAGVSTRGPCRLDEHTVTQVHFYGGSSDRANDHSPPSSCETRILGETMWRPSDAIPTRSESTCHFFSDSDRQTACQRAKELVGQGCTSATWIVPMEVISYCNTYTVRTRVRTDTIDQYEYTCTYPSTGTSCDSSTRVLECRYPCTRYTTCVTLEVTCSKLLEYGHTRDCARSEGS